jgi:hypothetical protein
MARTATTSSPAMLVVAKKLKFNNTSKNIDKLRSYVPSQLLHTHYPVFFVCDGLMALHFFAEKREVENYKKRRN